MENTAQSSWIPGVKEQMTAQRLRCYARLGNSEMTRVGCQKSPPSSCLLVLVVEETHKLNRPFPSERFGLSRVLAIICVC